MPERFCQTLDRERRVSIHAPVTFCVGALGRFEDVFMVFKFSHDAIKQPLISRFFFGSGAPRLLRQIHLMQNAWPHNLPSFRSAISSRTSEMEIMGR